MRGMNSETVDLIATDPPFNKGKDFHATPDSLASGAKFQDRWSWDDDIDQKWIDQIADDWPNVWYVIESARESWGDDMGAYLCFMGVRLIAMRRLLKPTGSIYLHCDPTASHYLKMLMDSIFDRSMFLNEIIWHYDGPQRPSRKRFGSKHDVIFRYAKTSSYLSNEDGIAPFQALSDEELSGYKCLADGRYYYTTPRGDYTDKSIQRLMKEDRVEYTRNNKVRIRHFLPVEVGIVGRKKQLPDVWSDIVSLGHAGGREKTNFPTQKPLALYERIIRASSKEGDMVLDPFAGCATTCVAAERLNREWVGIDIWDGAYDVTIDRFKGVTGLESEHGSRRNPILSKGKVHYLKRLPKRTDEGETDAPYLKVKNKLKPREVSDGLSNSQRKQKLLDTKGTTCQGCGRTFDDARYLELDHNTPRADGGSNNISNRILLCSPCNRLKSHKFTLSGLIMENKKRGYMKDPKLVESLR